MKFDEKKMVPCGCKTCTCDLHSGAITLQSLCWLQSLPLLATVLDVFNLQVGCLCCLTFFDYTLFHVLILKSLSLFGHSMLQTVFHVPIFKTSKPFNLARVFHSGDMLQCMHSKSPICVAKLLIMFFVCHEVYKLS